MSDLTTSESASSSRDTGGDDIVDPYINGKAAFIASINGQSVVVSDMIPDCKTVEAAADIWRDRRYVCSDTKRDLQHTRQTTHAKPLDERDMVPLPRQDDRRPSLKPRPAWCPSYVENPANKKRRFKIKNQPVNDYNPDDVLNEFNNAHNEYIEARDTYGVVYEEDKAADREHNDGYNKMQAARKKMQAANEDCKELKIVRQDDFDAYITYTCTSYNSRRDVRKKFGGAKDSFLCKQKEYANKVVKKYKKIFEQDIRSLRIKTTNVHGLGDELEASIIDHNNAYKALTDALMKQKRQADLMYMNVDEVVEALDNFKTTLERYSVARREYDKQCGRRTDTEHEPPLVLKQRDFQHETAVGVETASSDSRERMAIPTVKKQSVDDYQLDNAFNDLVAANNEHRRKYESCFRKHNSAEEIAFVCTHVVCASSNSTYNKKLKQYDYILRRKNNNYRKPEYVRLLKELKSEKKEYTAYLLGEYKYRKVPLDYMLKVMPYVKTAFDKFKKAHDAYMLFEYDKDESETTRL